MYQLSKHVKINMESFIKVVIRLSFSSCLDGFFALPEVGSCGWVPSAEAAAQCDAGDVWRPGNRGMAFVCLIKYVLRIRYAAKSKY